MSLSPLNNNETQIIGETQDLTIEEELLPSKTYRINFETGELEDVFINERDALKQSIFKMLLTPRYRHLIYSTDYGSELDELIGEDLPFEYLRVEMQRLIEETLTVDDRILSIDDFTIEKKDDTLYIQFRVNTSYGDSFNQEVQL